MRYIDAGTLNTPYGLLERKKVKVACESCGWSGRRVVHIHTNMIGSFGADEEELKRHHEVQKQQTSAAMHQLREMKSYPSCPRCGGDVYHKT